MSQRHDDPATQGDVGAATFILFLFFAAGFVLLMFADNANHARLDRLEIKQTGEVCDGDSWLPWRWDNLECFTPTPEQEE